MYQVSKDYTPNQPSYSSSYLFVINLETRLGDFLKSFVKKLKNLFMGKL